jgi:hypothetical protein
LVIFWQPTSAALLVPGTFEYKNSLVRPGKITKSSILFILPPLIHLGLDLFFSRCRSGNHHFSPEFFPDVLLLSIAVFQEVRQIGR